MTVRLFPYQTLLGPLKLAVGKPYLLRKPDGETRDLLPDEIDEERRSIFLWPEKEAIWSAVVIPVEASAPAQDVALWGKEGKNLSATLVAECGATQIRQPLMLVRDVSGAIWRGEIALDRQLYSGRTNLACYFSESVADGVERYVGETDEWIIYFDEFKRPMPKGAIDIRWINFKTDPQHTYLHKYAGEMTYANVSGQNPIVYLNKDFEDLPRLFAPVPRPAGNRRALLEPVRTSIAKSVWLLLFQEALSSARTDDGGGIDWPTLPWKENVLKMILPYLHPNIEPEYALQIVYETFMEGDSGGVMSRAHSIISHEILEEGKLIRYAMRSLDW